jgi:hypothetical protein
MSATALSSCFLYGAPELMENYRRYLMRGLLIAAILHSIALGAFRASGYFFAAKQPIVKG